jgi:hypothetical protein
MTKPLVDEPITTISLILAMAPDAFYRAALPLSRKTLTFTAGIIRRHRAAIGSLWQAVRDAKKAGLAYVVLHGVADALGRTVSLDLGAAGVSLERADRQLGDFATPPLSS